jgi:hypothetical protein
MSDMRPVSKPPFLLDGRGAKVITVVVIAVLIAVVKPWGVSLPPHSAVLSSEGVSPVATGTPAPSLDIGDGVTRPYDPLIFGDKELQPTWGLWPAGYLVTFGFAMHAEPSDAPRATGGSAGPSATVTSDTAGPVWPDEIDIPIGNHLLLIGVSTPRGYPVQAITLTRQATDGPAQDMPTVRPPSQWSTPFPVMAVDSGLGADRPAFWVPGIYELGLTIDPGGIRRSIEVKVEAPVESPSPSAVPGDLKP